MKFEELIRILVESGSVQAIHFHEGITIYDNHIEHNYFGASQGEPQASEQTTTTTKQTEEPQASKATGLRGRPRADQKTLADFVRDGVDVEQLRAEIRQRLQEGEGKGKDIALLEKQLIEEGKIRTKIPYVVLKAEFGNLIQCTRQSLNQCESKLISYREPTVIVGAKRGR